MLDDKFVIDSTVHGYHLGADNLVEGPLRDHVAAEAAASVYNAHLAFQPRGEDSWLLPEERFNNAHDPDLLAGALFAESRTDFCVYHGVPMWGLFRDGGSPAWVGKEMRSRWPGRVALYGPISPWQPDAPEEVDRLVEEDEVVGLKLYPMDIVEGRIKSFRLDDPELVFPLLERARDRGIRVIGIHKAIPAGRVPLEPFDPIDVDGAAAAFPELTFEIVHGGYAFLEETLLQLERFPNVLINLEWVTAFLPNAPKRFAEIVGACCYVGGADRLLWATGCTGMHPRPMLEAFQDLEMPAEFVEGYGYPPLDDSVKRALLGENHARILGLDIEALRSQTAGDEFDRGAELAPPWTSGAGVKR